MTKWECGALVVSWAIGVAMGFWLRAKASR